MNRQRLSILDGYRALAILLVVGFHYFSRWTQPHYAENLYPYGGLISNFPLFEFGHLGVQLFFIISGFVITLTLIDSLNWIDFAIKRAARLFPAMLLCSLLTFFTISALPIRPFSRSYADFLPSLTFIDPQIFEIIFQRKFAGIDGAYWSLFVEIKFYFWACLLFFVFGRNRFLITFGAFFNLVVATYLIAKLMGSVVVDIASDLLFARNFLPWFTAGVAFYYLYRAEKTAIAASLAIEALIVLLLLELKWGDERFIPFYLAFFGLFFLFIYRRNWVGFFAVWPLPTVGAASYSLYLLHQSIGVTLISTLGNLWRFENAKHSIVIGPLVAVVVMLVSVFIYRYWEIPGKNAMLRTGRRYLARGDAKQEFGNC